MATSAKDNGKTEAGKAETREYVVLRQQDDSGLFWREQGYAPATTPKQAIAAIVDTLPGDEQDGTFVAVPARNWSPLTRRTETVVKASWS